MNIIHIILILSLVSFSSGVNNEAKAPKNPNKDVCKYFYFNNIYTCEFFNVNITTKNQVLEINAKKQDTPELTRRITFLFGQIMRYVHPEIFRTFSNLTTMIFDNILLFEK